MRTKQVLRLWRVEWVHRNGYHAPYNLIEAKTRTEAVKLQKESRQSRLRDFPESWSWHIVKTNTVWSDEKNKWVEEDPLL